MDSDLCTFAAVVLHVCGLLPALEPLVLLFLCLYWQNTCTHIISNTYVYMYIHWGICICKFFMKQAPAFVYFLQSTVTMFGSLLLPVPPPPPYKYPPVLGINKNCWINCIMYFDFQGTSHISSSRMAGEIVRIACCPWKMATNTNTVILVSDFVSMHVTFLGKKFISLNLSDYYNRIDYRK